jgi:hypothetical protein
LFMPGKPSPGEKIAGDRMKLMPTDQLGPRALPKVRPISS